MLPSPLPGPRKGPTWVCSGPKIAQIQVVAGAEHCKTLKMAPKMAIASKPKKHISSLPRYWGSTFRSASNFQAQKLQPSQDKSHSRGSLPPNFSSNACSRPLYAHSIPSSPLWQLVAAWWDGSWWDFSTDETTCPFCGCPSVTSLPSIPATSPGSLIHPGPGSSIKARSFPVPNLDDPRLYSLPGPKMALFSLIRSHSQAICCHSPFISRALILVLIKSLSPGASACMCMHIHPSIHIRFLSPPPPISGSSHGFYPI